MIAKPSQPNDSIKISGQSISYGLLSLFLLNRLPPWAYSLVILSVWSIIPWAWLYSAYYLTINLSLHHHLINHHVPSYLLSRHTTPKPSPILFCYAVLELAFSIYYFYLAKVVQRRLDRVQHEPGFLRGCLERVARSGLDPAPTITPAHRTRQLLTDDLDWASRPSDQLLSSSDEEILAQALAWEDPRAVDFRSHQVVWFGNCRWEEIHRENFIEWLTWILFNCSPDEPLACADKELVDRFCTLFEFRAGGPLPLGYNPRLQQRVMRLTLDNIRVTARPLLLYAATGGSSWLFKRLLIARGFVEVQGANRLHYLVRKPIGWDEEPVETRPVPFIFIHGLGLGLVQYPLLLNYLVTSTWAQTRPVMILVQPSISLAIFDSEHLNPPSKDELISDLKEAVEELGFSHTGLDILGHSNGTMVATWIIKSMGTLVRRVCLVDPVCFCLWEGHVCHNFLYAEPKPGIERLLRYFLATELGIAKSLHRHFDWASNTLWPHDLPTLTDPNLTSVFIAGNDTILNPDRIFRHLRDYGMKEGLVLAPEAAHGSMLAENGSRFRQIIEWLERGS